VDRVSSFGRDWSASLRRGSENELRQWLDVALACCDLADRLALASFRQETNPVRKPDRSFVTEVDRAIERLIRERIASAFPEHGLIGEEEEPEQADAAIRWYIDPIDGTHNYMRGIPLFGTLLAVERDSELQIGVISAPALRQRWVAWRGGGAWGQGGRLQVSEVSAINDASFLYPSRREVLKSGAAPGFDKMLSLVDHEGASGDLWGYGLVAEGNAEAVLDVGLKSWDIAAPRIVVEEAGGCFTDLAGKRSFDASAYLASNGHLHHELLRVLADIPSRGPIAPEALH
jgi:histidinol-phosphatase